MRRVRLLKKQGKGKTMSVPVIFDLDGTLWDATGAVYRLWNEVFAERPETVGVRLKQSDMFVFMGRTIREIGEMLFPDMEPALRGAIMRECSGRENAFLREHGGRLYGGLRGTLESLAEERRLYIVSNCQEGYIEAFLHAHRLKAFFRDSESSGRTGKSKGENVRLLMERNGEADAVYVGDTAMDERAARLAGIPFVFAAYGFGKAEAPDAVIEEISELPRALAELGK